MPLMRRGPGLVRGVARTAVVAGTATAVSGRVARRQQAKYAEQDGQVAAQREGYAEQAYAEQAPPALRPRPRPRTMPRSSSSSQSCGTMA